MNSKWQRLQDNMSAQNFLANNPVVTMLAGKAGREFGKSSLQQYYWLVAMITQFLILAMCRIKNEAVQNELRRNLEEELGSRTRGIPHQQLLEHYLLAEAATKARVEWNEPTKGFITNLLLAFNTKSVYEVVGMIYALEATATPELLVVGEIINLTFGEEIVNLQTLKCGPMPDNTSGLSNFLSLHTLDFEQGHESGLRTTLESFITGEENWTMFEEGFCYILFQMQLWWTGLARNC